MQGSSRGPLDDGRIKPDVLAPGGYVWSCRAQEAADTGGRLVVVLGISSTQVHRWPLQMPLVQQQ